MTEHLSSSACPLSLCGLDYYYKYLYKYKYRVQVSSTEYWLSGFNLSKSNLLSCQKHSNLSQLFPVLSCEIAVGILHDSTDSTDNTIQIVDGTDHVVYNTEIVSYTEVVIEP